MEPALYAGTIGNFGGSMAEEIEKALATLMGPLPSTPENLMNDRRALFIAIAQGVITHLQANQDALKIAFDIGPIHVDTHPDITVRT
jgi:hypothetical protein